MTIPVLEALNRDCFCFSLDPVQLASELDTALGAPGLSAMVRERCPYAFAAQPVFVAPFQIRRMSRIVEAVESVVALPAYRNLVLDYAPPIARHGNPSGPRGVFFGYDFHLADGRLSLIELNTNAGGAMLNTALARAQRACCEPMELLFPAATSVSGFEEQIVAMFRREWRLGGSTRPLASLAIVDDAPREQYLYPEFLLFQRLFERNGIKVVIAPPADLEWRDGRLMHDDVAIDLVYNRLTDFYLEQAACAALREAWLLGSVVLTPSPQSHALYADKRHLALFSDAARLSDLGVPDAIRQVLIEHVPHTEVVNPAHADRLWQERRQLFFKPATGFGSRAAYRGDKLTRRVWDDILAGEYVAQQLVASGLRMVGDHAAPLPMKFDLRAYAYSGQVQWVAARLYQGQTTNFRTPGGGFAPVYSTVARGAPAPARARPPREVPDTASAG